MTLNNRKAPRGIAPKAEPVPWRYLRAAGGISRFRDENNVRIHVPDTYSWRPAGWPPLSLEYARNCGQPDGDNLPRNRPHPRRLVTDVPTGGVV